ncbi:hypothetical protein LOTGIDRAFT_174542 [Lottia gigantea]|uniref:Uncharacterized protein n=1 Tax=Lottia gigantea TaxID=225164 RepID=V4ATS2_LOTGI|nr:hypothetical protein LOTGIDRAFT_174542 [Lottia gigantea]ESO97156.1 hypothetical protein LOTGIDRAFT_174542 [Lottia gigantea]
MKVIKGQDIGVNCRPEAVVGQPYNLQCTNIPDTLTKALNVFLQGDTSNSIIYCVTSKNCVPRNSSLYSVVSPHTDSFNFTIKSITTDDIGKKVYCVDDIELDLSTPKPSCTIEPPPSTTGMLYFL